MSWAVRRLLKKGHRLLQRNDPIAAEAAFARAAETAPDDPRGALQLALAQARRGACDEARHAVQALVERFPDRPVALLFAGRSLLECDDPAGAEPLLRAAAERQPENLRVQQTLALCELMQGRIAESAARFENAGLLGGPAFLALLSHEVERRLKPEAPAADPDAALAADSGEPPAAGFEEPTSAADSDAALAADSGEPPAPPERLAQLAARLEARVASRRVLPWLARRRAARILARTGERAYDREDFPGALVLFETLRRVQADAPIGHFGAGLAALKLNHPLQAVEALAEAHRLQPDDPLVAASYAQALYRAARFDEALAMYEKIEPAGPDDFHAHYGRGACLTALGRKAPALEQFRIAFERFFLDTLEDCLLPAWKKLVQVVARTETG